MKRRLIIFGAGQIAELAHFYFKECAEFDVAAFTVDSAYLTEATFCGLPVVAFEELARHFGPEEHEMFVALSYAKLNSVRKEKYLAAKAVGYRLASYLSPRAMLLNEGCFGDNCFVLEANIVQPFVRVGNNVTLWSGNHIGHHTTIRDHTFIASHVAVSGGVEIGEQCFIGVNATLRDHIKIGARCVIGAGTLMLHDAATDGVYAGASTERGKVPSSVLRGI